jgi:hypothetical protein
MSPRALLPIALAAAAGCAQVAASGGAPAPVPRAAGARDVAIAAAPVAEGSAPALLNPFIAFYAGFDRESVVADLAVGAPEPVQIEGTPRFVPGRFGRALLLGAAGGGARVYYAAEGNLDFSRSGAVSFWISPVRWISRREADERDILALLTRRARAGGAFVINRTGFRASNQRKDHLNSGFFDLPGIKRSYVQVRGTEGWTAGVWHLVVLNWTRSGFAISVDGGELEPSQFPVPLPFEAFRIRGRESPFAIGNDVAETTAMDELATYTRPLRLDEVQSLYGAP